MEPNNDFDGLSKFLDDMMRRMRRDFFPVDWSDTKYRNEKTELARRGWNYWAGLPAYASMYIRPAYNGVCDTETLVNFLDHFLGEYMETENHEKRLCIEVVIFPIYYELTGRNFNSNLIAL